MAKELLKHTHKCIYVQACLYTYTTRWLIAKAMWQWDEKWKSLDVSAASIVICIIAVTDATIIVICVAVVESWALRGTWTRKKWRKVYRSASRSPERCVWWLKCGHLRQLSDAGCALQLLIIYGKFNVAARFITRFAVVINAIVRSDLRWIAGRLEDSVSEDNKSSFWKL